MASGKNIFNMVFAIVIAVCIAFGSANPDSVTGDDDSRANQLPTQREGRFYGGLGGWGWGGYPYGGLGHAGSAASAQAVASSGSIGFGK